MKRSRSGLCVSCLVVTLALGCTHGDDLITKDEAIAVADSLATKRGVDLRQFARPDARYEMSPNDGKWAVFYLATDGPNVGEHFHVTIDARTGEAKFHGGM